MIDEQICHRQWVPLRTKDIKPFTSIGIGGGVKDIFVLNQLECLSGIAAKLDRASSPYIVLGGGSNTLFSDQSERLTVLVNRTKCIRHDQNGLLTVDSGVFNKDLLEYCSTHNLGGIEFLAGIPGTIGGAAAVNAGAFGKGIADILHSATVYTPGEGIRDVESDYFEFSYRYSKFKYGNEILLMMRLNTREERGDEIKKRIAEILALRGGKHPDYSSKTAGCFFKNPLIDKLKVSAGKLIEDAGFKGMKLNRIYISEKHSNFFINGGSASFEDIVEAESLVKDKIFKATGIKLEREVIYIHPDGSKD